MVEPVETDAEVAFRSALNPSVSEGMIDWPIVLDVGAVEENMELSVEVDEVALCGSAHCVPLQPYLHASYCTFAQAEVW